MEPEGHTDGISRRQALKRVAAVGAIAWATPVVQTLNMQRAWAASPADECHSVKLSPGKCEYYNGNNKSKCFKCYDWPSDPLYMDNGCANVMLTVNPDGTWTVKFLNGCYFDFGYVHGGSGNCSCVKSDQQSGQTEVKFTKNCGRYTISNVQLNFCCPPSPPH